MRLFILAYLAILGALTSTLTAQTSSDTNSGTRLDLDPTNGSFLYSWWGSSGHTYFIQHSDDLSQWHYLPIIEQGFNDAIRYGFIPAPDWTRLFLRLHLTSANTNGDPYAADFDTDGIPNGWEIEHGLNPFDSADAATINNGISNLVFYQQSLGAGADPSTINPSQLIVYSP